MDPFSLESVEIYVHIYVYTLHIFVNRKKILKIIERVNYRIIELFNSEASIR